MWDMMKSKNCIILGLFLLTTSISIWLIFIPTPNLHNIMTETQKQITSLKNMNVIPLQDEREINLDETYLELLGFTNKPKLYPNSTDSEIHVPVIVTGVYSSNYKNAFLLIESVQKYLPSRQVLIFDLGLGTYELVKLKKHCNETSSCLVRPFDFDKFPGHVRSVHHAYKPVAIQEALNEYTAIIWTDADDYFIRGDLEQLLQNASKTGIAAWTTESKESTTAFTHPKMFSYFKTPQSNYFFHRMVSSSHLVIYNTKQIHKDLMLPWVQCALTIECIWPTGAQCVHCNYQRKPRYLYSLCHYSDMSALNVILGLMFENDVTPYTTSQEVFGIEEPEENTTVNTTEKTTKASVTGI